MRNPFDEKRKNERISRLVKERDEAVNELKQVREELSIQTTLSGMLERVVGDLERKLKAAQGRNGGHTGFFDTQDNGVYYIEHHLEDVEEGGVKRYKDWSSDWVEPPFSVGDTVYKFGSFSITKNKRYSEQLCRETGIPEKQYVIVKIK